jgi:hypothetical protein
MRDGKFTVAVGRKWFRRAESNQANRYDHGGISFAEMVVPGVVMQLITEKKFDIGFDGLPQVIQVAEGATHHTRIWIKNKGNQPSSYELISGTNTDASPQVANGTLAPGARIEITIAIRPVMEKDQPLTQILKLALAHPGRTRPVKKEIPIMIEKRNDVVEISFGGLDDLDK